MDCIQFDTMECATMQSQIKFEQATAQSLITFEHAITQLCIAFNDQMCVHLG